MNLSSETTADRYNAAADQTIFFYSFRIDDSDHLDVYVGTALKARATPYPTSASMAAARASITSVICSV